MIYSGVVYEDALSYGNHLKRKHNTGKRWSIEGKYRITEDAWNITWFPVFAWGRLMG